MMLELTAPAKLNLFLHIVGRRADGYHLLQTVMQLIDFSDTLTFSLRDDGEVTLTTPFDDIPITDNLVYRAALLLQQAMGITKGADITLHKALPSGAGLGGGSSDAATTLLGLHQLWSLSCSIDVLADLGLQLGADVPVFVRGQTAWVEGIGEKITPIELPEAWYVLLIPNCHVSTGLLFQDPRLTRDCAPLTIGDYRLGVGRNVFTEIVQQEYPPVAEAFNCLGQYAEVSMTGTGAVVFARFDTEAEAGRIAGLVPKGIRCVVAKGLNFSPNYWGVAKR